MATDADVAALMGALDVAPDALRGAGARGPVAAQASSDHVDADGDLALALALEDDDSDDNSDDEDLDLDADGETDDGSEYCASDSGEDAYGDADDDEDDDDDFAPSSFARPASLPVLVPSPSASGRTRSPIASSSALPSPHISVGATRIKPLKPASAPKKSGKRKQNPAQYYHGPPCTAPPAVRARLCAFPCCALETARRIYSRATDLERHLVRFGYTLRVPPGHAAFVDRGKCPVGGTQCIACETVLSRKDAYFRHLGTCEKYKALVAKAKAAGVSVEEMAAMMGLGVGKAKGKKGKGKGKAKAQGKGKGRKA